MPSVRIAVAISVTCILSSSLLILLPLEAFTHLTDEDSWIENIGAISYLVATISFMATFIMSKGQGNRFAGRETSRNLVFLGLGLLFFVAFAEEISWGQRIFGVETPEFLKEHNAQGETNLHNLSMLNGQLSDGSYKEGWDAMFTSHRIYNALVLLMIFLIPLAFQFWGKARKWLIDFRFPIAPLSMGTIGFLLIVGSKTFKEIAQHPSQNWNNGVTEITETNFSIVVALIGLVWVHHSWKAPSRIPTESIPERV